MEAQSKPYKLAFEKRSRYLRARVTASEMTPDIARSYLSELAKICKELNISRLMLERHIPGTLSAQDDRKEIISLSKLLLNGLRLAIVEPQSANLKELESCARVARSKNLDVEVFDDVEEAKQWLLQ
jgi:hypothetical protein